MGMGSAEPSVQEQDELEPLRSDIPLVMIVDDQ